MDPFDKPISSESESEDRVGDEWEERSLRAGDEVRFGGKCTPIRCGCDCTGAGEGEEVRERLASRERGSAEGVEGRELEEMLG